VENCLSCYKLSFYNLYPLPLLPVSVMNFWTNSMILRFWFLKRHKGKFNPNAWEIDPLGRKFN
jgi:hypothetical protein